MSYPDPGYIADVVDGDDDANAAWANAIRDRVVHRFDDLAERDASIPVPTEGMLCYVASTALEYVYDTVAAAWVPAGQASGGWARIAEVVRASTGAITFSSIPQTFTHLALIGSIRSARAATSTAIGMRFNGDGSAIYDWEIDQSTTTTPTSIHQAADTDGALAPNAAAANTGADKFSPLSVHIPNYRAVMHKHYLAETGLVEATVTATISHACGFWRSTAAITSIDLWDRTAAANSWAEGSAVTLLGLR